MAKTVLYFDVRDLLQVLPSTNRYAQLPTEPKQPIIDVADPKRDDVKCARAQTASAKFTMSAIVDRMSAVRGAPDV
jgi:hypothetical protein